MIADLHIGHRVWPRTAAFYGGELRYSVLGLGRRDKSGRIELGIWHGKGLNMAHIGQVKITEAQFKEFFVQDGNKQYQPEK